MSKMMELNDVSLDSVAGGHGRSMSAPSFTINAQMTNNSSIYLSGFSASAIGIGNTAGVVIGVTQVND